jgi:hypothetical protein
MKYTREQYMNHECSHREYHAQFVNESVKNRVVYAIGMDKLLASTDKHLNDIPLKMWDTLGPVGSKTQWDAAGDYATMSGRTCIYKEAARQVIEQN